MRSVPLLMTSVKFPGRDDAVPMPYATLILSVLGGEVPRGVTVVDQRLDVAVMDAIEAAVKAKARVVLLEEPQWARLLNRMETHAFPFSSRASVEVTDAIKNAPATDPNAKATEEKPAEGATPAPTKRRAGKQ